MEVLDGQRVGSFVFASGHWLVFKHMGGVGGQAPPAGALIKPLAAISPLRHVVGQGSRAVFPPGPVELGGPLPCAIGSGDQV